MNYLLDTNACITLINGSPAGVRPRLERALKDGASVAVGAYDLLIAGQALRHDATLVTATTAEFARVDELHWEDWASPS